MNNIEFILHIFLMILILVLFLFIMNCNNNQCKQQCIDQYGIEAQGRNGVYERCSCVLKDGTLKAPRK